MIVITIARKPFPKTLVDNIQKFGAGSLNIDASRIDPTGEWLGGGDEHATTIDKKRSDWSQPWMHRPEDAQRHADMMKDQIKQNSLKGRFPSNVILEHKSVCQSLGLTKIKGTPQTNFDKLPVEERIQSGEKHGHIWGRGVGIGVKGVSYTVGFGDKSGMEPMQSWECVGDCPVRQIDVQSGGSKSTGGRTANISATSVIFGNGKGLGQDISAEEVRGDPGYGDLGGASRYFKQIKQESLVVLSLFDGMSCGQIALNRLGIKYGNYYASEIDKYAIAVTQHNYPNTIQLGSVTQISGKDLPQIDLLIGGSPCQGFSFAGKLLNFDDPRSKLFFEFVRLLKELKPKYFLLENVKMRKEYEYAITALLGVSCARINSNLVSAQNRKRLYWTNIPGDGDYIIGNFIDEPEDKELVLQDILDDDSNAVWHDAINFPYKADTPSRYTGKASCLRASAGGRTKGVAVYNADKTKYRLMTPEECESLQTVPRGYTNVKGVSNTQRYKMLGNGWTVDVIAHILKNMEF